MEAKMASSSSSSSSSSSCERPAGVSLLSHMAGDMPTTSSHRPRGSVYSPRASLSFLSVLIFLYVFAVCLTTAASQQYNNGEDSLYNYYYHHDSNNYNGMDEYVSDWSQHEWAKMSGRIQQPKCVDIPSNLTLCQGIGYETMRLPNLLDHDSLKEVTQQAGSWVPLTRIACHPDTKVFLCSLFSPVCLDSLDRLIYPCRSLCQNVRASCESRMTIHGFEWPAMLECEKFPLDNDMCIMPIHDIKPDNNCTACKHPQTHEALIDHFCRSDVAMRVTLKDRRVLGTDLELVLRKRRKLYKFENMEKKEAKNLPVVIAGGTACTCETINDTQGKYLLMGNKRNGKIVINFGMAWKRKDKEFRKGLRAIRKGDCKQLFKTVIDNLHEDQKQPGSSKKERRRRKKKQKRGKKGNKKGRKGKRRKGKKGRKGRKKGKKGEDGGNKMKKRDNAMSKSELEDRALSNFLKAAD